MNLFGPALVYLLCLAASAICALLLARSYRQARTRLLLWVSLGFAALAVNNLLLVADMLLLPTIDLSLYRQIAAGVGVAVILYGFIWEAER